MARRSVVGLDIGTSTVRAAQVSDGRRGPVLERFGQVALRPGAVRGGEVVDPDSVALSLRQLWAQARLQSRDVVVGVANQRVVVRQIELPWMPLAELRASLAFQVQDVIPIPVDQAILDVHPLQELVDESGRRTIKVLLVAAARDMVGAAVTAVERAGLRPVAVDLTSFAVLRSALASTHEDGGAEALVDVGASVTNIIVHEAAGPRFVRILLMGGDDVTAALSERLEISTEQAEELKQVRGLSKLPAVVETDPAARALELSGGAFVEEVRSSLDYYAAQPGATPVSRIVLSGGGSRLPGLADRLSAVTRLPVERARPLASMRLGRTGLSAEQIEHVQALVSVPVGLALGGAA